MLENVELKMINNSRYMIRTKRVSGNRKAKNIFAGLNVHQKNEKSIAHEDSSWSTMRQIISYWTACMSRSRTKPREHVQAERSNVTGDESLNPLCLSLSRKSFERIVRKFMRRRSNLTST